MTPASDSDDLAGLTLARMLPLVDSTFRRANDPEADIFLQLVSARLTLRDPSAEEEASGRPFALLFRGPTGLLLTQGRHDLQHPTQSLPGVFLVPVGSDKEGPLYEAVFG